MSAYTLKHIIQECIEERNKTSSKSNLSFTDDSYHESMNSLNSWIETRLSKRMGASLGFFGNFTWEFKIGGIEGITYRPIFIVNDAFAKAHNVKRQRIHTRPVLSPSEEVNFSQLSIKYSKLLTKDMMYSSIMTIFRKIGDYIDRFYDFEVEFSFGILKCRNRRLRFEFNTNYLIELFPSNMSTVYTPKDYEFNNDIDDFKNNLSLEGSNSSSNCYTPSKIKFDMSMSIDQETPPQSPSFNDSNKRNSSYSHSPALSPLTKNMKNSNTFSPYKLDEKYNNSNNLSLKSSQNKETKIIRQDNDYISSLQNSKEIEENPILKGILSASRDQAPTNSKEIRDKLKEKVANVGYLRCLDTLSKEANEQEIIARKNQIQNYEMEDDDKRKQAYKREESNNLKDSLEKQKEFFNKKKLEYKLDFETPSNSFFLKAGHGKICNGFKEGGPHFLELRDQLRDDLLKQIKLKAELQKKDKDNNLREEQAYLDHISKELELTNTIDRMTHLEKQQELIQSWEKDAHILQVRYLLYYYYSNILLI